MQNENIKKVLWTDIREFVKKIEPKFASKVDILNPGNNFPLYIANYSYGDVIADPQHMYLPINEGCGVLPITPDNSPLDVCKELGYGKNSLAMGMVLDKELEAFIDLKDENSTIPWLIYKPGTFFPFAKTLSLNSIRKYSPNNILTITAGARSVSMLPNIGCQTNHFNLQREYDVQSSAPKKLYDHWNIFKEIIKHESASCDWKCSILFFSEKWFQELHQNPNWLDLKLYLHELAWEHFEFRRNSIYYDIAFSLIQKKRNLRPNPYLTDTASHLFVTAIGAAPGFRPAIDETALPLEIIQKAYVEVYGLKKYLPTIMQPSSFYFEIDTNPIYYSLQNPSTFVFSPKSRKISSTLFEMHELRHIMQIFVEELAKVNTLGAGTIISEAAKKVEFNYFHNEKDGHKKINLSKCIFEHDDRFNIINPSFHFPESTLAADARFLRGCISIRRKINNYEKLEN